MVLAAILGGVVLLVRQGFVLHASLLLIGSQCRLKLQVVIVVLSLNSTSSQDVSSPTAGSLQDVGFDC
jgi:hypothetical protein